MTQRFDLFVKKLRNAGWDTILERSLQALDELKKFQASPTPYTLLRTGMSLARTLSTSSTLCTYDVFDGGEWVKVFHSSIKLQLVKVLEPFVTSRYSVNSDGSLHVFEVHHGGVHLTWARDSSGDYTPVYTKVDCYETSLEFAREQLWTVVDSNRIVLSAVDRKSKGNKRPWEFNDNTGGQLCVSIDDLVDAAPSAMAERYVEHLRKCMDLGIKRTMLFYGLPGSGKSTAARTICDDLNLRSLRIRVEDIQDLSSEAVEQIVEIYNPDAIIFDDLDCALSQVQLLETMQTLHRRVKFIFATVNDLEKLSDALRRPGRFDEVIKLNKLDDVVIRRTLGEHTEEEFSLVRNWPIAFVREYTIRRTLLGKERAREAMKELRERVAELRLDCDEEEETSNEVLSG